MTNCQRCSDPLMPGKIICITCGMYNLPHQVRRQALENFEDGSVLLRDVKSADDLRLEVGEWNMIFGGKILNEKQVKTKGAKPKWGPGLVRDSVTILGGLQGCGKSTGLMQLLDTVLMSLPETEEALYIGTEETNEQIKARADRTEIKNQHRIRMVSAMTGGVDINTILIVRKPCIVIVDSLNGLVGEDDAAAVDVCKIAKVNAQQLKCPFILTSHVNKGSEIAGVNTIQHAVDTVMLFLPHDDDPDVRELEVNPKNRFGRAFIKMWFVMTEKGLVVTDEPIDELEEEENGQNASCA